jgi:hypothetical protein
MNAFQEEMDSNQVRMAKFGEKMEETIEHQMQHFLLYVDESTQNLPEKKKTVPDPRMMPSA